MNTRNEKLKSLKDIAEVKELKVISDVNQHIKLGWKLLDTYKTISADQNQSINYCLGWPKSAGVVDTSRHNPENNDAEVAKKFIYSF